VLKGTFSQPTRLRDAGLCREKGFSLLAQRATIVFKSEGDRLLAIEALRLAASHWNATARAVAEKDWHRTATHGIATRFEQRAIDTLRLAYEIEAG
jgi:hypothetical protein